MAEMMTAVDGVFIQWARANKWHSAGGAPYGAHAFVAYGRNEAWYRYATMAAAAGRAAGCVRGGHIRDAALNVAACRRGGRQRRR